MDARTIIRGAMAGMVGGMMMGIFAMLAMWLDGQRDTGFWTPLNLIAHTIWRGAPLDYEFSGGALVLGGIVHMMMSMGLGAAIAVLISKARQLGATLASRVVAGVVIAMTVWAAMEYIIWPLIDSAAADAFTTWIFAVAHLVFGMTTPLAAYALSASAAAAPQASRA
ncbi:MAG TPA: hypothetical protein VFZ63_03780 [Jiangellaceae bacterium]